MKIKFWILRSCLVLFAIGFLCLSGLILYAILYRYPNDKELRAKFPEFSDPNYVINTEQSDIGWYIVESKQGEEGGIIEVFPQWIMPWESYDWNEDLSR